MQQALDILKKYWGYDAFRPLQEDIINSVLQDHDTLALLPTGGGKSLCFQVPALCMGKLCIVISPLIALMKDQVENLERRGIPAAMISSLLKPVDIEAILDRAAAGELAFLYVSPERLVNELFLMRLGGLKPGLIAVDEAHCISQWGYDFRPSYLRIAEIRGTLSGVPVIALTATATPQVCDDIESKLLFSNNKRFRKSFTRSNLAYIVREAEDKLAQMLRILEKIPGTSVVYVRNRRKTREVADFLVQNGVSASYYHAGLDPATRNLRQQMWIDDKIRVIVCTNAFGMGIDKPEVRTVIHLELPDSPEAYFQEAGRAGRDGKTAWAVLLRDPGDEKESLQRFKSQFPGFDTVKAVYNWIGNFLNLAVGAGEGQVFAFDIANFANRYNISPSEALRAIRFIEREGLLGFQENHYTPARIFIPVTQQAIYEFEFKNPAYEPLIKAILRSYGGIFNDYVQIKEQDLVDRTGLPFTKIKEQLTHLDRISLIRYYPSGDSPQIVFLMPRQHPDRLPLSKKNYESRMQLNLEKMQAMLSYSANSSICRSIQLVSYFGEKDAKPCGQCDVCIEQQKNGNPEIRKIRIARMLEQAIAAGLNQPEVLLQKLPYDPELVGEVMRSLIDENILLENTDGSLQWKA